MTLLNKQQAAEMFGCSTKTIERMVNAGKIAQYRKTPGTVAFSKEELEAYIQGTRIVKQPEEKTRKKPQRRTVKVNMQWRPGEKLV